MIESFSRNQADHMTYVYLTVTDVRLKYGVPGDQMHVGIGTF